MQFLLLQWSMELRRNQQLLPACLLLALVVFCKHWLLEFWQWASTMEELENNAQKFCKRIKAVTPKTLWLVFLTKEKDFRDLDIKFTLTKTQGLLNYLKLQNKIKFMESIVN